MVKQLFELAKEKSPSIIFIDEIDSIGGERGEGENESSRRVKNEILAWMSGMGSDNNDIVVIAATNNPWKLDQALRRRFQIRVYIPLPEKESRKALLKIKLKDLDENLTENDYDWIAEQTEGYSGSDLQILCMDVA